MYMGGKVLFIGKAGHADSVTAATHIQQLFPGARVVFSRRTDPFPQELLAWEGDLLISYLAQWIIPGSLLEKAAVAAINFHPGPPAYPGIGCTNFAVYNGEKEFGITCHHMKARVDSGAIIAVRRFPVTPDDTVYAITQRCYAEILTLFYELMGQYAKNGSFPVSGETWQRKPYTRKQLDALCVLQPGMSREEIALRLKATTYGSRVWAQVEHQGALVPYEEALKSGLI